VQNMRHFVNPTHAHHESKLPLRRSFISVAYLVNKRSKAFATIVTCERYEDDEMERRKRWMMAMSGLSIIITN
jgi:hypothetical protein